MQITLVFARDASSRLLKQLENRRFFRTDGRTNSSKIVYRTRPPYALRAYIELQSRRVKPAIKIPARLHSYNSHPILNQFLLNPQPTPIQSSSNSHPFSSDSCPIIIPLFSISHPIFIILPKFSPNYHSIFYPFLIPFFLNSFILIQIFILI